ncbi:MAG: hypothetical protein EHM61_01085 [Acidobacteria bacterium]|nr:MAG: hypothetical protein EHM61_01085 [Acidobacteriota bacterium]
MSKTKPFFPFLRFLPLLLLLISGELLAATVSLSWSPNPESDIAGYWVYRTQTPGTSYIRINTTLAAATSFSDTTCSSGATYYYAVTAVNTSNLESPKSNVVQAVVQSSTTNSAPVANAGPDLSVASGVSVNLRGSGTDANGDPLTFAWTQTSGASVTLSGANTATASFTSPTVTANTTLSFRLTVRDGKGGTGTDDVKVTVTPPTSGTNSNPIVNAGPDRYVLSGSAVTCYGSGSDPNGDPITFAWHQVIGTTVVLNNAISPTMSFVAPKVTSDSTLKFRLWVKDNRGGSARDDVVIKVTTNSSLVSPATLSTTYSASLDNSFVGVALLNPSVAANTVAISTVDGNGIQQVVNTSVLGAQVQEAFLAGSLTTGQAGAVSLKAQGENENLRGFFLVGDGQPDRLDGVGGTLEASTRLYFPAAKNDTGEKTLLFLTNPDSEVPASVSVNLVNSVGASVRTADLQLAPGASRLVALPELLGDASISGEHYLELSADIPVNGFQLISDSDTFSSSAGRGEAKSRKLWVPHFVLGNQGEDTQLRLINTEAQAIQTTLKFYNDQGSLIATRQLAVPARGLSAPWLSDILGRATIPADAPFLTGYVVLEASDAGAEEGIGLLGTVTFTVNQGKAKSTLPMLDQPREETLYLHVAQSPIHHVFTGLALMNAGSGPASAKVQIFDPAGKMTGEKTVEVAPGQRMVGLLDDPRLFGPEFQQVGGHMKIVSDRPLVSFVMFADGQLRYLSALEGQGVQK